MVSLKIQKRSVLVLILTLILFSGNTIIIGYVTPLLYLVGFFSFIWGDRKQIRSNKYTSRIIGIYLAWLIFLIINTVQSYDFSASKSMIPVFIIGGVFCLFSWNYRLYLHQYDKIFLPFFRCFNFGGGYCTEFYISCIECHCPRKKLCNTK